MAALRQAACELAAPLAAGNLLPPDQAHLVRFHLKVGWPCAPLGVWPRRVLQRTLPPTALHPPLLPHTVSHPPIPLPASLPRQAGAAWAGLGELEAAEAVLSRGSEAAAALLPTCFERRGRGPLHQEAASLAFELLLERLDVALHLGQEVGGCCWKLCKRLGSGGRAVIPGRSSQCRPAQMSEPCLTSPLTPASPPPHCIATTPKPCKQAGAGGGATGAGPQLRRR